MAARSQWKGFLKISLVSVPVKAFSAATSGGGIQLNQLHAECNSRIKHVKTCPLHGEVKNDDIVSGYEYSKDQYVRIDTDELDKLRTEDDKAIKVNTFIKADALDPLYLSGKSYFLVPEGPVGQKAYEVIYQGMVEAERYALAQVVMHGKEQLVLLRPYQGLLVMSLLYYNSQVSSTSAFEDEIPKEPVSKDELQLAKMLIKTSSTDKLDYAKFKDAYTEKLTTLIEAKVAGKELVAPPAQEEVQVINLMDALKKSVEKMQKTAPPPSVTGTPAPEPKEAVAKKPPRKMAPSKGIKPAQARKRKSS